MSHFYGIVQITAGTQAKTDDLGGSGLSGILIGNESGLTVKVTLQGANISRSLYPGTVDFFDIPQKSGFIGVVQFDPVANLTNATSWPCSYVQIDTFGIGEKPSGTYPLTLPRNTNVGNAITTNVTNSTLVYDGAVAGSQFVEAKPAGDTNSTVTLDNSGNLTLGDAAHAGSLVLKGTLSTDAGAITTDGAGDITAIKNITSSGNVAVGGTLNVTGTTTVGAINTGTINAGGYSQGAGDMNLNTHNILSGNNITISGSVDASSGNANAFGTTTFKNGISLTGGDYAGGGHNATGIGTLGVSTAINLPTGTLKALTSASGTGNGTSNTFVTNPTAIVTDCCTLSGSTQTMGATKTTTTTITTNSGLGWSYIAYLQ